MELWQLDIMGGIWLTDGRELKAVTGIDDHSRFCVAAGLIERANARSVCRIFTQALERYGSPEELLTDNGKVFTGRLGPHPSEVLFDRICREHGHHPPVHRGPLPDHHRQDRTVPQDPPGRAAHRPPLRLARPSPTGAGRLGGRLQHPTSPPGDRHGRPGQRFEPPTAAPPRSQPSSPHSRPPSAPPRSPAGCRPAA